MGRNAALPDREIKPVAVCQRAVLSILFLNLMRATATALLITTALASSGCATGWTKPGVTQQAANVDQYQCEQEAAKMFPAAMVTITPPTYPVATPPAQTSCINIGGGVTNCMTTPVAKPYPVIPYTQDANAGNRSNAIDSCLLARGYQRRY